MESTTPENVSWRKGSRCGANGGCVEMAALAPNLIGARDAHIGDASPVLRLAPDEWRSVLADIRRGLLDMPS